MPQERQSDRAISSAFARFMRGTSTIALSTAVFGGFAAGQEADAPSDDSPVPYETIIVEGIRGSLQRAMDIKRNSDGVVDAISSEDIGKFPDTNLAESMQRIPGVSINRVNGEGSRVTVRGFGSGFNLVTLNGRSMPTADLGIVGGDQNIAGGASGASRAFDFSSLASEGVSGLEVYKTGNAVMPSGGIGAVVNIKTVRPLENPGFRATAGAKALYDSSIEGNNSQITPELSGLLSWTDDQAKFGIGLFGSIQRRNSDAVSSTSQAWNVETAAAFLDPANGKVTADTKITNRPDPATLVSYPNDSRYHFSEVTRERVNGQLVLQFQASESVRLTADATYARSTGEEKRFDQSNWFNRPFKQVRVDQNPAVATATFLQEDIAGAKDYAFQQELRGVKDELQSFGFNADWAVNNRLFVILDAHTSQAKSLPDGHDGTNRVRLSIGAPVISAHSADYSGDIPVQSLTLDDTIRGNGNGKLDAADVGSQIARSTTVSQVNDVDEIDLRSVYDFDGESVLKFGVNYRSQTNTQKRMTTQQTLGNWGINNVGDIEQYAPGVLQPYCLTCMFDGFNAQSAGVARTAFRGDPATLYTALTKAYADQGNASSVTADTNDVVKENTLALYARLFTEAEILGRPARIALGLRYEDTDVTSTAQIAVPESLVWEADNDFSMKTSSTVQPVSAKGSYSNFLPNLDLAVDITEDFVARASYSVTIARTGYDGLFVSDNPGTPPRPTALGGITTGTTGNAGLLPLESNNYDISFEWYYDEDSFVSVGAFEKRVRNFVGTGQSTRTLFGLRDPSAGAAGSRSGAGLAALDRIGADRTDVNLFTITSLIQRESTVAAAEALFRANYNNGALDQAFIDQILADVDIAGDSNDPLVQFEVTGPINNREGTINGIEIAGQHFFGDTGFGLSGSYTLVRGDVGIDVAAAPDVDQFALLGLSDTANITAIYEKHGVSARLAYNWRDEYLASSNRGGGNRNPVFVEAFAQLDLNVSYDITPQIAVSFEGINLLGEDLRTRGRSASNLWFAQDLHPRYYLGVRYKF